MTYLEYDYELCRRRRQHARMERLRQKLWLWRLLAVVLAAALCITLCIALQPRSAAAELPPQPVHAQAPSVAEIPAMVLSLPAQEAEAPQERYSLIIENATVTHYCICEKCCGKSPDHPAYGITASGRAAEPYVSIAVDPAMIPLGSIVYVDYGDGELHEYRADDTGSGVAGAHIDLCVASHEEALQLGVRTAKVYVREEAAQ